MPRPELCSVIGQRILDQLREEFEREGRGSLRRVSRELGLSGDYLATRISRGSLDVGIFFAALDRLGVSPQVFLLGMEIPSTRQPLESDPPVTRRIAKRWENRGRKHET